MSFALKLEELKKEIKKSIVGNDDVIELLLNSLLNGGHVLLESVPGTGKTKLAKSFAETIDGEFRRIQFTPDLLPSDITGIQYFHPKHQDFQLRFGPIMTNILLADEINRATPRTQSSLLEIMEEKQVTIDGGTYPIPSPFMIIATQNPVESIQGTFPLPEAQVDRFFMQIPLTYPNLEDEREVLRLNTKKEVNLPQLVIITHEDIKRMQEEVKQITLLPEVEEYILNLVRSTRNHTDIDLGVSPRGMLSLAKSAKANAYFEGRSFVTPDDVKKMAPFVLTHRIVLSLDAMIKYSKADVISKIIDSVEVPVEEGVMK